MSSNLVIEARGLSKRFKLYDQPRDRFFEWMTFGKRSFHDSFWALRNVDVHLKQGEKLGIIGANGSGKSTLLKILAGSLSPTEGSCRIEGRAFALLELSTGFNRDLTGRENINFVGMMLGLDRAYVASRRDQIISFADIGDFIDRPVRFYSSGMFVRLAFSMFAFLEPDLLMIDEAFAVGDAEFKEKSYKLMQSMVRTEGRSVIFVSHSMVTIEGVCDRVMWLEHGVCRMDGDPKQVIEAYRDYVKERKHERLAREEAERSGAAQSDTAATQAPPPVTLRTIKVPDASRQLPIDANGKRSAAGVAIDSVWLEAKDGTLIDRVGAHRKFTVALAAQFDRDVEPQFGVRIFGSDGAALTVGDTSQPSVEVPSAKQGDHLAIRWPIARGLPPGSYDIVCWCSSATDPEHERAEVKVRVDVEGPPRVEALLNLVMRPTIGRAVDDR